MSVPPARTSAGRMPLTVAWVPTGMNAGVRTMPCGVASSPQRAAPSVAMRRKKLLSDMRGPEQQTRITVGIEAIVRSDRVGVDALHGVEPGESCDQHEQGRARQVEVGHQDVDRTETVARHDE